VKHSRQGTKRLQGLYAITNEKLMTPTHFKQSLEQALKGGARIIQYRDKSDDGNKRLQQAKQLKNLCQRYHALCIINDDIDLCLSVNADGVHLGKEDSNIAQARKRLGDNAIIGASCYNQLALAQQAENEGADYVAFGAIFNSSTKPLAKTAGTHILQQAKSTLTLPICAIGGIDTSNAQQTVEAGADMIAVINSLFAQKDIFDTARRLNLAIKASD